MATDDRSGLTDDVTAELNPPGPGPDNGPQPDPIPDRPADGAAKDKWGAYVVALGLHPDQVGEYTRDQLVALAARLGG